jgi:hypothetical protein
MRFTRALKNLPPGILPSKAAIDWFGQFGRGHGPGEISGKTGGSRLTVKPILPLPQRHTSARKQVRSLTLQVVLPTLCG